jgi:hypothetical protein
MILTPGLHYSFNKTKKLFLRKNLLFNIFHFFSCFEGKFKLWVHHYCHVDLTFNTRGGGGSVVEQVTRQLKFQGSSPDKNRVVSSFKVRPVHFYFILYKTFCLVLALSCNKLVCLLLSGLFFVLILLLNIFQPH